MELLSSKHQIIKYVIDGYNLTFASLVCTSNFFFILLYISGVFLFFPSIILFFIYYIHYIVTFLPYFHYGGADHLAFHCRL